MGPLSGWGPGKVAPLWAALMPPSTANSFRSPADVSNYFNKYKHGYTFFTKHMSSPLQLVVKRYTEPMYICVSTLPSSTS